MFVLLYGRKGLFAPLIAKMGFPIVFAFPGGCFFCLAALSLVDVWRQWVLWWASRLCVCIPRCARAACRAGAGCCGLVWQGGKQEGMSTDAGGSRAGCQTWGFCCCCSCCSLNPPGTPQHRAILAGMALATLFVTLPFVVRELLPILEQMDMAEEEAARCVLAYSAALCCCWAVSRSINQPAGRTRWSLAGRRRALINL